MQSRENLINPKHLMNKPSLTLGLLLTLFVVFSSLAQTGYSYKEKKADRNFEILAYHKAIRGYNKVIDKEPTNARAKLKLAESYFVNNDTENAEKWYAEVINKNHLVKSILQLHYAQVLQSDGKFDKSLRWAKKYLGANPRSEVAQNMVYSLQNVGKYFQDSIKYTVTSSNINTPASEFAPTYYKNGIVFSSSRSKKLNLKKSYSWDKSKYLDLYVSEPLIGNEMLSQPVRIKGKVNSKMHEGPATFFQEDSRIIFTRNSQVQRNNKAVNNLNLFTAILPQGSDQWKRLEALPFNSKNYSVGHPSMDNSGAVLYYVSDMPGGKGGTDIYKIVYVRGKWGAPQNLGASINTPGNEMFPYVDANDVLYFASNGHPGLGGLDIYQVDLRASNKQVKNLGYPINSTKDDFSLITKDNAGYLSSNRGGNDDIYQFEYNTSKIEVLVHGEETFPFQQATVILKSNGYVLDTQVPDAQGKAVFEVAPNLSYELQTQAPGFTTNTTQWQAKLEDEQIDVNLTSEKPLGMNATFLTISGVDNVSSYILTESQLIEVKDDPGVNQQSWLNSLIAENNISIQDTVEIKPIHYKFDKTNIDDEYQNELMNLVSLMEKYGYLNFELGSHTDARGSAGYNQLLSQRRATSALSYLVAQGVSEERILAMGYGESKPINNCVDNHPCNNEKHLKNRRTEFKLIYMNENQVVSNY